MPVDSPDAPDSPETNLNVVAVVTSRLSPIGLAMARQKEVFIAKMGSTVTLPNGTTRLAMVHHNNHDLLRVLKSDGDSPEKKAVVFVFSGSAWGIVTEGARISIGIGGMLRDFIVADPLHPNWRQDVIVELAVVAWPA